MLDQTTRVTVTVDRVSRAVIMDITDPHVPLNATVTVAGPPQPVTVSLDPVTGVVILDITETSVVIHAAVIVVDFPRLVTVSVEPVINVMRGFMDGPAQISVM